MGSKAIFGNRNIGSEDFDLGEQGNKAIYFREQGNIYLREGVMHALIISPFIQKGAAVDVNYKATLQRRRTYSRISLSVLKQSRDGYEHS